MKRNLKICEKCEYYQDGLKKGKTCIKLMAVYFMQNNKELKYRIKKLNKEVMEKEYKNTDVPPNCPYRLEQTVMNQKTDI